MDSRSNEVPKHTPGPWLALPYTGVGEFGDYAIVCHTRDRDIAAVEEEADAQLIAAAPEMLEALKQAQQYVYWAVCAGFADATKLDNKISCVIAKAERRQP